MPTTTIEKKVERPEQTRPSFDTPTERIIEEPTKRRTGSGGGGGGPQPAKTSSYEQRSARNYLVNRQFQLKWVSLILVLTTLLFGTLSAYIYQHERHASEAVLNGLNQMYTAEEVAVMKDFFISSDKTVLWGLASTGALLVILLAGVGIVLTHRMAGPVHALSMSMAQVRSGRWKGVRGVRDGDEFQELAQQWVDTVSVLCKKEELEVQQLEDVCMMDGVPEPVKVQLIKIAARKRRYVE